MFHGIAVGGSFSEKNSIRIAEHLTRTIGHQVRQSMLVRCGEPDLEELVKPEPMAAG